MATNNSDSNAHFYHSLRNAQPLAFLASFSMVIAAFSFSNPDLFEVYNKSVVASIMFLISFVISLVDQLGPPKESDNFVSNAWFNWGKFFFLGFGILYLGLVALEFSRELPQITNIMLSWTFIAIGGSGIGLLFSKKIKLKKNMPLSKRDRIVELAYGVFSFGMLALGLLYLGRAFMKYKIKEEDLSLIFAIIFGICMVSLFLGLLAISIISKRKKTNN